MQREEISCDIEHGHDGARIWAGCPDTMPAIHSHLASAGGMN